MSILSVIEDSHWLPLHRRPLKRLIDTSADIANPVYEIQDYLRDRTTLDPPKHDGVFCDNPKCPNIDCEEGLISGFRYYCIDCVPDQVDFCSTCAMLPGQGINHNTTHRLMQLLPTKCVACQSLDSLEPHPDDFFRGTYLEYSASGATLNRVAEARACALCTFVWNALLQHPLENIQWPPSESQEVEISIRKPFWNWLEIVVLSDVGLEETDIEIRGEVYTMRKLKTCDKERALQVGLPPSDNFSGPSQLATVQRDSGSDEALVLAKMWLDHCRERHTLCSDLDLSVMPLIRVLDLLSKDSRRVYLREAQDEVIEYAALSYCWGPGAPGLFTSKSNFTSHREDGIEIEKLPKMIREAIHAARKLDIRFLWVDRLCIIQDSPEDWKHQAALMCSVYSGATVTLSADGSDCATQGLFHADQALSKLDYQKYHCPDGDDSAIVLIEPLDHPTLGSRIFTPTQPIDSRGWTMQEWLLSRRVIHFTRDEMVWECDILTECECRRESRASRRELSGGRLESVESAYVQWRVIAQAYTQRSLRCDADKMPALSGLVEKFKLLMRDISGSDSGPPDEYLAGLWRGDLVAQLAWKPPSKASLEAFRKATDSTSENERLGESGDRTWEDWLAILAKRRHRDWHETEGYIAPSWSWAHLRGPISYHLCYPYSPFIRYAEVIEARVLPIDPDEPTGPVSSGYVTLNGHLVRGLDYTFHYGGWEDGHVEQIGWLTKEEDGYQWWIWFEPDDCSGLKRRHGNGLSNVILFLLGAQDIEPTEEGKMSSVGAALPTRFRRRKLEAQPDVLETGVGSLDIASSVSKELSEVFRGPPLRWTSFLVLAESDQQRGKFERIGCFDVFNRAKLEELETLFHHSTKEQVTII